MKLAIWLKDGAIYRARRMRDTDPVDVAGMDCLIVPLSDNPGACPQLYLRDQQVIYLPGSGNVYATGLPHGVYGWSANDRVVYGINTGDIEPPQQVAPAVAALHRALSLP